MIHIFTFQKRSHLKVLRKKCYQNAIRQLADTKNTNCAACYFFMKKSNHLRNLIITRVYALFLMIYLLFCLPIVALSKGIGATRIDATKMIKSAFDPKMGVWNIDWPERVSQYDLVYKSPPIDPMQGIAIGNGDVAALKSILNFLFLIRFISPILRPGLA